MDRELGTAPATQSSQVEDSSAPWAPGGPTTARGDAFGRRIPIRLLARPLEIDAFALANLCQSIQNFLWPTQAWRRDMDGTVHKVILGSVWRKLNLIASERPTRLCHSSRSSHVEQDANKKKQFESQPRFRWSSNLKHGGHRAGLGMQTYPPNPCFFPFDPTFFDWHSLCRPVLRRRLWSRPVRSRFDGNSYGSGDEWTRAPSMQQCDRRRNLATVKPLPNPCSNSIRCGAHVRGQLHHCSAITAMSWERPTQLSREATHLCLFGRSTHHAALCGAARGAVFRISRRKKNGNVWQGL